VADDLDGADSNASPDAWGGETDWDLIRRVSGRGEDVDPEKAWLQLVERYRVPVKRLLRRMLRNHPGSDDAADDFFSYLFQKQILPKADPEQGRFRCYIQGVMKRYARSWLHAVSMPRAEEDVDGIDFGAHGESSELEREEELMWAEAVLGHALERLRRDFPKDAELLVRFYGIGGVKPTSGDELAKQDGRKDNSVHVAVHRARGRLHKSLMSELAPMVSTQAEFDEERRFLVTRLLAAHPGLDLTAEK
jgi:RNA polymerase sigma factor (sigma-70 family)